jgi:hypothetical protein
VTFKDLQKLVQVEGGVPRNFLQKLQGKPLWTWDPNQYKQEDIKTKGIVVLIIS